MNRNKIIALIVILIAVVLIFRYRGSITNTNSDSAAAIESTNGESNARKPETIENYVKENISALSPVSATVGGTFYVTSVVAHGGAGTVNYEDGHNAYVADFTYTVDQAGVPSVTGFILRNDNIQAS